jgi:drug/metabolite transporter (DMT)-like permease
MFIGGDSLSGGLRSGDLIVFSAVIFWSFGAVYTKKIIAAYQPFQLVLYPMVIAVPFFLLEGFLFDAAMVAHLNPPILGALFYMSFVTASFGFVAWITLLKRHGATTLHSFVFIMPIAGVLCSGLVLKEPITLNIIVAGILIALGILIVHRKPNRSVTPLP